MFFYAYIFFIQVLICPCLYISIYIQARYYDIDSQSVFDPETRSYYEHQLWSKGLSKKAKPNLKLKTSIAEEHNTSNNIISDVAFTYSNHNIVDDKKKVHNEPYKQPSTMSKYFSQLFNIIPPILENDENNNMSPAEISSPILHENNVNQSNTDGYYSFNTLFSSRRLSNADTVSVLSMPFSTITSKTWNDDNLDINNDIQFQEKYDKFGDDNEEEEEDIETDPISAGDNPFQESGDDDYEYEYSMNNRQAFLNTSGFDDSAVAASWNRANSNIPSSSSSSLSNSLLSSRPFTSKISVPLIISPEQLRDKEEPPWSPSLNTIPHAASANLYVEGFASPSLSSPGWSVNSSRGRNWMVLEVEVEPFGGSELNSDHAAGHNC